MCGIKSLFIRPRSQPKIHSCLLDPLPFPNAFPTNENDVPQKTYFVDKHLLDSNLARDWLEDCDRNHPYCKPPPSLKIDVKQLLFVDVLDERIVFIPPGHVKFAALSYVWGHCEITKTTSLNLDILKRIGGLSSSSPNAKIPRTVRDAMHLTARLGLRYLWVDCLSII
ncbi:hypothetical protein BDV96DRAFT_494094, partial [Lophiotrema nucula]